MFTQSTITSVSPPKYRGGQVFLSWTSSAPSGTYFQIYVDRALSWYGQRTSTWLPIPSGTSRVEVGSVDAGEEKLDFSASLAASPARRASLSWAGGTFEGADLASFRVYGESTPGGGIDYGSPLATVASHPQGIVGASSGTYTWTGDDLTSGTWHFGVRPVDSAGNEGPAATTAVTIAIPPAEVPIGPGGDRLNYRLTGTPPDGIEAVLTWLPSPG